MKHLYIIFLALLACCPEVIHAENEISYLAEIGIQNRGVVKKGREVQLTMLVDLSELKIKTCIRYHMNIQIRYAGNQAFRQGGLAENILSCNGTSSNYDF